MFDDPLIRRVLSLVHVRVVHVYSVTAFEAQHHQYTLCCRATVFFVLLAVLHCRFSAWLPSLCSRTHRPDRLCARRSLAHNQLSGSLPSSLGSLPALFDLYVVVLSVSASARGATNALVLLRHGFLFFFCWRAPLPVRCVAAQSLLTRAPPPRSFVRAQVPLRQPAVGLAAELARVAD